MGERVRALHELGLYVCVDAAGQLRVPDEARLHSQPTLLVLLASVASMYCILQVRGGP